MPTLQAKEKSIPRDDLTSGRIPEEPKKQFSSNKLASTFKAFDEVDAKDKVSAIGMRPQKQHNSATTPRLSSTTHSPLAPLPDTDPHEFVGPNESEAS